MRYYRNEFKFINKDLYKSFKKEHPKYKDLSYSEFLNITSLINEGVSNEVIENRNGCELANRLGLLIVASVKKKGSAIDMKYFSETGEKRKILNEDTGGYSCKLLYTNYKNKYSFTDKYVWSFNFNFRNKRNLSNHYKENWGKYLILNTKDKLISSLYSKDFSGLLDDKKKIKKEQKEEILTYNEFNF
jgi:hypothetical protein